MNKEVKDLQEQIRDRRAYLNEQEQLIAEALDEGNEQLKAKQRELEQAQSEKEEVLRQVFAAQGKALTATKEAGLAIEKTAQLKTAYEKKALELRASLQQLQKSVDEANETLRQTSEDAEARIKMAQMLDKEVQTRKEILEKAVKDLQDQRRKLESDQAVANSR